jgi:hypothetical protein
MKISLLLIVSIAAFITLRLFAYTIRTLNRKSWDQAASKKLEQQKAASRQ